MNNTEQDNTALLQTVKKDLDTIETALDMGLVDPYEVVDKCMSPELRDTLGSALYAHSANMDQLSGGGDE